MRKHKAERVRKANEVKRIMKEDSAPESAQSENIEHGFHLSFADLPTDEIRERKPDIFKKNI